VVNSNRARGYHPATDLTHVSQSSHVANENIEAVDISLSAFSSSNADSVKCEYAKDNLAKLPQYARTRAEQKIASPRFISIAKSVATANTVAYQTCS